MNPRILPDKHGNVLNLAIIIMLFLAGCSNSQAITGNPTNTPAPMGTTPSTPLIPEERSSAE